jgi:hypothetical protein
MRANFRRLILTETTKLKLSALRKQAYLPKFGDRLRDEALLWNLHDEASFHFGAYVGENLVSTIRLSRIETKEQFETVLQISGDDAFASLPCWALSRAATDPHFFGQSLNMRLRTEAYRFILSRQTTTSLEQYVYGTALANSARIEFLRLVGYEIEAGRSRWNGYVAAESHEIVNFRIPLSKLESAIQTIDQSL